MPDQPTLAEVAAAAGVSPATASRVLTGSVRVRTSARVQVHAAMARLGYVPRGGGDRRQRRTVPVIAAVVCESTRRLFTDSFFARLITGAEESLAREAVPLIVLPTSPTTLAATERFLVGGGVDGVLLISAHRQHPLSAAVSAAKVPVRCAGRPADDLPLSFVDADNRGGARRAVEHLMRTGRRTIATIAGPPDLTAAIDRLAGYKDGLEEAALPHPPVAYGDFTQASGSHAMGWLLHRAPNLDAVFVASDLMAVGAIHTLRRAGRRVPDDVAVIGFDDAPAARYVTPALTTVRQPVENLGAVAAELLLGEVLEGRSGHHNPVLPTELVIRQSA